MTALGSEEGRILDVIHDEEESNDDSNPSSISSSSSSTDFIVLQRVLFYQVFSMDGQFTWSISDFSTGNEDDVLLRHWFGIVREMLTILFCISLLKHFIRFHIFEQQQDQEQRTTLLSSSEESCTNDDDDDVSESSSLELTSSSCLSDEEEEDEKEEDVEEEEIDLTSSYGNYSFNSNRVDVSTCYNESDFEAEAVVPSSEQEQEQQQQQASLIAFLPQPTLNSSIQSEKEEDEDGNKLVFPSSQAVDFPSPYSEDEGRLSSSSHCADDDDDENSSLYSIDSECSWFQDHYGRVFSRDRRRKLEEER